MNQAATALLALRAACEARVGTEVHLSDWLEVTQERIDAFAHATGDFQWIHVDAERARRESPWQTTIAHGLLTLSLYASLRAPGPGRESWPGVRTVINYGLNRVRFVRAVKAGARLRLRVTLAAVRPVAGAIEVEEHCRFELEEGSAPACIAELIKRLYP